MANETRGNQTRVGRGEPALPAANSAEGSLRPGFTLMETLIVVTFIALLLMMAVPSLVSLSPYYMVRSSAKGLESLLQRGRLLSYNSQKPTRVVVDCRANRQITGNSTCTMRMYLANFNADGELAVTGGASGPWVEVAESRREVPRAIGVAPPTAPAPTVAAGNPTDVYWAVFLPTGRARTSHDPMRLIFSPRKGKASPLEVGLSQYSGRATVRRP